MKLLSFLTSPYKEEESTDSGKKSTTIITDARYLDYCGLSVDEMRKLMNGTDAHRQQTTKPLSKDTTKEVFTTLQPMGFFEELVCVLFLAFSVPTGVFTIPPTVYLIGRFLVGDVKSTFLVFGLLMLPLVILPQPHRPKRVECWISCMLIKYFSFRLIIEETPRTKNVDDPNFHPQIMVAPPHGVFPYGNILAMLSWSSICGSHLRALAASSALRPPLFKQLMRGIGVIDASRDVARKALEEGESLGISTGGVAEVFETNGDDECILLKERIGMIKLAIRTGADLKPCYLFGNTKLLGCWMGEGIPNGRSTLEKISRKIGFALILIYGRFGLPIPRRIPILAIVGKAIPTHQIKCEEPSMEQIEKIQTLLLKDMEAIFDRYKGMYGWEEKHLIIK